jgi:hypothetical protein
MRVGWSARVARQIRWFTSHSEAVTTSSMSHLHHFGQPRKHLKRSDTCFFHSNLIQTSEHLLRTSYITSEHFFRLSTYLLNLGPNNSKAMVNNNTIIVPKDRALRHPATVMRSRYILTSTVTLTARRSRSWLEPILHAFSKRCLSRLLLPLLSWWLLDHTRILVPTAFVLLDATWRLWVLLFMPAVTAIFTRSPLLFTSHN